MSYLLLRGLYGGVASTSISIRADGFDFLPDFRGPSIGGLRWTTGVDGVVLLSGTFIPFVRSVSTTCIIGISQLSIGGDAHSDADDVDIPSRR